MFDIVGRSPFSFMTFGRCTDALRQSALPSFPSVLPAECNPQRALASLNCVGILVLAYPLEDCYADTYQEDVPADNNHDWVPSLLTGALYISQPAGSV